MEHQFHIGKKFYKDLKTGYWISTSAIKIRAHVWVWEHYHGKRPKGFHVHHKDGNKSNNDISNLELLSAKRHLSDHMTEERRAFAREHAAKIRPLTKEWHRSIEGRKWHKAHGIEGWNNRNLIKRGCLKCEFEYETKVYHQYFCSNKCKSSFRRASKVDDIELTCLMCKNKFKRNKYGKSKTCSPKCGGLLKSKNYQRGGE